MNPKIDLANLAKMIRVIHKQCGKVAFFFKKKVYPGNLIKASNTINLDGDHPNEGEPILCGHCGNRFILGDEEAAQEHWTDWFMKQD